MSFQSERVEKKGYDYYDTHRGRWAWLINESRQTVMLTEWPGSLLGMYRANLLRGEALRDARALDQALDEYGPERSVIYSRRYRDAIDHGDPNSPGVDLS